MSNPKLVPPRTKHDEILDANVRLAQTRLRRFLVGVIILCVIVVGLTPIGQLIRLGLDLANQYPIRASIIVASVVLITIFASRVKPEDMDFKKHPPQPGLRGL